MRPEDKNWLESPEVGCVPADLPFLALADTFVSGDSSTNRLSVRYFHQPGNGTLLARVLFGPGTQGPPGHAHGGSMAALCDEAMGGAAWLAGYPVVAAQLNITFRTMLPLGTRCVVEARVEDANGRKIKTTCKLRSEDGTRVFCSGEALFLILDQEKIESLSQNAKVIVERIRQRGKPNPG
jgi:acyl-coenzyme A thioesterase PaaI-like protein